MSYKLTYKSYGERAILIEWPQEIHADILNDILVLKENILNSNLKSLLYLKPSYNSLLVVYKNTISDLKREISNIDNVYSAKNNRKKEISHLWKVPVCYDPVFGIDLEHLSEEKNMSKSEIIALHSQSIYTVYFIGFLPGFLYLGGLPDELEIPRKSTPRLAVEKGAVAIGGNQTGVYPNSSPGGWHIIGNSPIDFFNINRNKPCFAKAGDKIQFYPISLKQHHDIKVLSDADVYMIESEVLSD